MTPETKLVMSVDLESIIETLKERREKPGEEIHPVALGSFSPQELILQRRNAVMHKEDTLQKLAEAICALTRSYLATLSDLALNPYRMNFKECRTAHEAVMPLVAETIKLQHRAFEKVDVHKAQRDCITGMGDQMRAMSEREDLNPPEGHRGPSAYDTRERSRHVSNESGFPEWDEQQ